MAVLLHFCPAKYPTDFFTERRPQLAGLWDQLAPAERERERERVGCHEAPGGSRSVL